MWENDGEGVGTAEGSREKWEIQAMVGPMTNLDYSDGKVTCSGGPSLCKGSKRGLSQTEQGWTTVSVQKFVEQDIGGSDPKLKGT